MRLHAVSSPFRSLLPPNYSKATTDFQSPAVTTHPRRLAHALSRSPHVRRAYLAHAEAACSLEDALKVSFRAPCSLTAGKRRWGWKEINVQALIHCGTYPIGWLTGTKLVSRRMLENIHSVVGSEGPNKQCRQCHEGADIKGKSVEGQQELPTWKCSLLYWSMVLGAKCWMLPHWFE